MTCGSSSSPASSFRVRTTWPTTSSTRSCARAPDPHRALSAKNDQEKRHMRSLDIAGTGMQAQQTNVEVIANNIANETTTGFKRSRAEFQDLLYQNLRRVGSNSSDNG